MSSAQSVTRWLDSLKAGEHEAARLLWDRYFEQLIGCPLENGGNTNDEIAAELGCIKRTVERKLHTIRRIWEKEGD